MGTPPPGGPPDTTAPAIILTSPGNGITNFSGNSIRVRFDEYVNEGSVPQALVITPIPAKQPEFNWSGRTLDIEFQEPLLENRTYAITFGAGITDLSNNRLGRPFTLRFATGPQIDSGRIQGEVLGRTTGRAFIFAYLIPGDSTGFAAAFRPDSIRPDFIAPVADDGSFSLEGLPNGRFRLFAVVDDFGDQLFTPGQDAYGLSTGDVSVTSATAPVTGVGLRLRSAPDDLTAPSIYGASSLGSTRTEVRFSEPIDSAMLRRENFSITSNGAAVTINDIWRTAANRLSVQLTHSPLPTGAEATIRTTGLRDTAGNALPDTAASIGFTASAVRDSSPPSFLPPGIDSLSHPYVFPDSIPVVFDEPVSAQSLEGALIFRDTAGPRARFDLRRVSPSEFVARPLDTLFRTARAIIEIDLRRFTDEAGNRRDSTVTLVVAVAPPRQSGSLEGTLADSAAPTAPHVIIARAAATGQIYTLRGVRSGPWSLPTIPEGEYEVSAFRDSDNDGLYDFGSILPYRPAEAYIIWRGPVRVRPRWTTNKVDLVFPEL